MERASARANPAPATLAPSKGRLIRCTVPGSTPNCLAMTPTPGLPGVARASRIVFRVSGELAGAARSGDMAAIKELADRLDGRPAQAVLGDDEANPISVVFTGVPRAGDNN